MTFTNTDCVKKEVHLDLDMLMNSNLYRKVALSPTHQYLHFDMKRHVLYLQVNPQIFPIRNTISQGLNK